MHRTTYHDKRSAYLLGMAALLISVTLAATGCESHTMSSSAATLEAAQMTATASAQGYQDAQATQIANELEAEAAMQPQLAHLRAENRTHERWIGLLCLFGLALLFVAFILFSGIYAVLRMVMQARIKHRDGQTARLNTAANMEYQRYRTNRARRGQPLNGDGPQPQA